MSREIKFRAWHMSNAGGVMLFVGDSYGTVHPLDCCLYAVQRQPVQLMQFTGLYDKNGREIYEGDIVTWRDYVDSAAMLEKFGYDESWPDDSETWIWRKNVDVVVMNRFPKYWLEKESFGHEGEDLVAPEKCEVIGNIHENPELLK